MYHISKYEPSHFGKVGRKEIKERNRLRFIFEKDSQHGQLVKIRSIQYISSYL